MVNQIMVFVSSLMQQIFFIVFSSGYCATIQRIGFVQFVSFFLFEKDFYCKYYHCETNEPLATKVPGSWHLSRS